VKSRQYHCTSKGLGSEANKEISFVGFVSRCSLVHEKDEVQLRVFTMRKGPFDNLSFLIADSIAIGSNMILRL